MKKSKIIVPALGILVLSTAASITGTVAWFSVNNSVTVDGMAVKTQVAGNLLIADENVESKFGSALTQGRTGTLEPASTVNGVNYFYTTDAKADGSKEHTASGDYLYKQYNEDTALTNTNAGKTHYDDDFVEAYTKLKNPVSGDPVVKTSNVVYGYIDYSFYLKATNTASSDYEIRMTKCNMLYKADGTNFSVLGEKDLSWRVAVFSKGTTQGTTVSDEVATGDNQKSILKLSSAAYFDSTAVNSTSSKDSVSKLGTGVKVASDISQGATSYTKVTVRLWLEGEDTKCNNQTYATLTKDWKLDLEFKFVEETDSVAANAAVTAISSVAA